MSLIRFNKTGSLLTCKLEPEGHRIRIISDDPIVGIKQLIEDGFEELNEHTQLPMVDFSDEVYLYHEEEPEHVFVLTNEEGDIWYPQSYVAPIQAPEPEPYVPSIDELKAEKIAQMEDAKNAAIMAGVTVTLSDGNTGTFGLNTDDQIFLTNLRMMAEASSDKTTPSIPWHEADESKQCRFYAPRDIITITDEGRNLIIYNETFFRDLRIYIKTLLTAEAVNNVTYDIAILPHEYWSEVLEQIVNG